MQLAKAVTVIKEKLVDGGFGKTLQDYSYTIDGYWYSRKVGSTPNDTVLYDQVSTEQICAIGARKATFMETEDL
ncbi:hypothetical protein Fmac_011091 [Flemingia macrophylla]|uniref:Uncharacterized protein n=1 Tax=Flemingia macrophylla TaxID=520843 RepID=A0ABD1MLF9_9FABA